jgi:hypothetical protein
MSCHNLVVLVIRREQLQAFEQPLFDRFIENSVDYVATYWPTTAKEYGNRARLKGFVTRCFERGQSLHIRDRGHLTTLLDWECQFGPAFDEKPEWEWLHSILTSSLDPANRIYRIENRLKVLKDAGAL